jgi:hypothetical protein
MGTHAVANLPAEEEKNKLRSPENHSNNPVVRWFIITNFMHCTCNIKPNNARKGEIVIGKLEVDWVQPSSSYLDENLSSGDLWNVFNTVAA